MTDARRAGIARSLPFLYWRWASLRDSDRRTPWHPAKGSPFPRTPICRRNSCPRPETPTEEDPYPRVPTEEGSPSLTADGRRTFRPSHRREGGLPSVFRAEGVSSVSGLYRLFFRGHLRTGEIGASLAGGGWPEGCIALGSLFDGGLAASGAGCPIVAENFFTATRQGQASTLHSYMNRCSYIWKMFGDPIEE